MKQRNLIVLLVIILLLLFVMFFLKNSKNPQLGGIDNTNISVGETSTVNIQSTVESNNKISTSDSTNEVIADGDDAIENSINAIELQAALNSDKPPIVISLNSKEVYDDGHIINSINIPFADDLSSERSALDKSKQYVVYGDTADQAIIVAEYMLDLGFSVSKFTDGIMASDGPNSWMSMGNPIISSVISAEQPVATTDGSETTNTEKSSTESNTDASESTEPESTSEESTSEESTSEEETLAESATESTVPSEYTVQAGDTIYKIGRKFGLSPNDIIAINQLSNPSAISPGQVIRLK